MTRRNGYTLVELLRICFQQRRKQLQSILRRAFSESRAMDALAGEGIAPGQRPETLSPAQFQALASRLFS